MVFSQNSKSEASWEIRHSISKWKEDSRITPSSVIAVVSVLLLGLLADQVYTSRVLWLLASKASEKVPKKKEDEDEEDRSDISPQVTDTDNMDGGCS